MIEFQGVSKIFGNPELSSSTAALNDINLKIENGEFIAIVGESGSGKSTLLNLIGCLDFPTFGFILFNKKNLGLLTDRELSEYRNQNIGFVFQDFYLDPMLSVFQNIEIPLLIRNVRKAERMKIITEQMNKVGLPETYLYKKISQLSGGEKQRVAVARALVNYPTIILADEPTGNLDKKNGENIVTLLKDINSNGITVIMVTHNLTQTKHCSRIIEMQDGKITKDLKK